MSTLSPEENRIFEEVLGLLKLNPPVLPSVPEFRVRHDRQRAVIDGMLSRGVLMRLDGTSGQTPHYVTTLSGLRAAGSDDALGTIRRCNALVEWLKEKVRKDPGKTRWTASEIGEDSVFDENEVMVFLTILLVSGEHRMSTGWSSAPDSPFAGTVDLSLDGVLDAKPYAESDPLAVSITSGPARLSRIYIHNFRSFVNFEWRPPAACVLVGDNGAGKSALVEVLCILRDLLVEGKSVDDDDTALLSKRTAWLSEAEQKLEIDIERQGITFRYCLRVRAERGRGAISEELHGAGGLIYRTDSGKVELFGDPPSQAPRTTIPFDRKRSFIAALEPRVDNRQVTTFRDLIASVWILIPQAPRIKGPAAQESPFLRRDLSNFASWYLSKVTEDIDAATALRDDLKRAMVGFSMIRFVPISKDIKDVFVRFSFGGVDHELPWAQLSDGQRLLIALYGVLRFGLAKASLIVLDEAENYVAPSEIQPWLRAVADWSAEHEQQLLVVSHHPESINYMAADASWRMWRDTQAGHTRIAPLSPDLDAGETAYEALKLGARGEPESSGATDE